MPRKKKTPSVIEEDGKKVIPEQITDSGIVIPKIEIRESWNVHDIFGNYVRTYDIETHGEEASKLADNFAKKIHGSVR